MNSKIFPTEWLVDCAFSDNPSKLERIWKKYVPTGYGVERTRLIFKDKDTGLLYQWFFNSNFDINGNLIKAWVGIDEFECKEVEEKKITVTEYFIKKLKKNN